MAIRTNLNCQLIGKERGKCRENTLVGRYVVIVDVHPEAAGRPRRISGNDPPWKEASPYGCTYPYVCMCILRPSEFGSYSYDQWTDCLIHNDM